jgi:hypothetical protein
MDLKAMDVCYNIKKIFVLLVSTSNFKFNVEVGGWTTFFWIDNPARIFKIAVPDSRSSFKVNSHNELTGFFFFNTALHSRQELRRCRNPFGKWNLRNGPSMQVLVYIYALAHFKCSVGKHPVYSLYKATENELQGSGMVILKIRKGPSKSIISK